MPNTTDYICSCCCLVTQSCLTLRDPMDCSPSGSSAHRISQSRILAWVAISSSSGNIPKPGIEPTSPVMAGRFFTAEAPGKPDGVHFKVLN